MNIDNLHKETIKVASELYERSGRVEGRDLDNWLEAERIVKGRIAAVDELKKDLRPSLRESIDKKLDKLIIKMMSEDELEKEYLPITVIKRREAAKKVLYGVGFIIILFIIFRLLFIFFGTI